MLVCCSVLGTAGWGLFYAERGVSFNGGNLVVVNAVLAG